MTLVFVVAAFMLPVPIAFAFPPPGGDAGADARDVRRRLLWIAAFMAAIVVSHHAFAGSGARPSGLAAHPTVLFVWVPWMLLFRYLRPGHPNGAGTARSAALHPRRMPKAIRRAWMALTLLSIGVLALIGPGAWQSSHVSALALLVPIPAWLGVGYWLAARNQTLEAETFPSREHHPALMSAYAQRRSLTGWGHLANFAALTAAHTALAAAAMAGTEVAIGRVTVVAVVTFGLLGGAHWWLRRRLDARIDAILTS